MTDQFERIRTHLEQLDDDGRLVVYVLADALAHDDDGSVLARLRELDEKPEPETRREWRERLWYAGTGA